MKKILLALILVLTASISQAATLSGILGQGPLIDLVAPTLSTITIGTNGTSWTFGYSEAVTCATTSHCCDDYTAAMTTAGSITLSYASGSGTSSVVCTGSPTVYSGDTVANGGVDYTTRANGIEDAAGNDLASFTDHAVTNNSTQSAGIAFVSNSTGCSNSTTCSLSVTAGNFLVISSSFYSCSGSLSITEPSTAKLGTITQRVVKHYNDNTLWGGVAIYSAPITGSGTATVEMSGCTTNPALTLSQFSGITTGYDKNSTGEVTDVTSGYAASLTPTNDNSLIVSAMYSGSNVGTSVTGDPAMTVIESMCPADGACILLSTQYVIQTTKTALQADWSWTNSGFADFVSAVFAP